MGEPSTWARNAAAFLFWAVIFGVSYSQAPLYYSNQNQYFLHGLARNGVGFLEQDWLANTKDPAPIFSAMVSFTHAFLHEYLFYAYYILLFGLYFHSLYGIFGCLTGDRATPRQRLIFTTLFVGIHAGLLRLASTHLLGIDYPWYFQAGLAGQYVLGFALQPSVFGVFLIASIHSFCRNHPWRAATWACLGAVIHSTYLLSSAFLTIAYMLLLLRGKAGSARVSDPADTSTEGLHATVNATKPFAARLLNALLLGLYSLALVLPVVIFNLLTFGPSSREAYAEAQRILAQVRIPHHAVFERWFDVVAVGQIAWIVLSILLARQSRLQTIMAVAFILSLVLSLLQLVTRNDTLALIFPWRTSAILVPLATTVLLTRIVGLFGRNLESVSPSKAVILRVTCFTLLAVFFVVGLAVPIFELGYRTNPYEVPLLDYVKHHRQPGEVYLLPVEMPKAPPKSKTILAYSTNFMPAPRAGKSGHLISIDLQRFRISTGAPIFVDFKSIPYKDVEVLEWYRRVDWAQKMYAAPAWHGNQAHEELLKRGITHVVMAVGKEIPSDALEKAPFEDPNYRLYRVKKK